MKNQTIDENLRVPPQKRARFWEHGIVFPFIALFSFSMSLPAYAASDLTQTDQPDLPTNTMPAGLGLSPSELADLEASKEILKQILSRAQGEGLIAPLTPQTPKLSLNESDSPDCQVASILQFNVDEGASDISHMEADPDIHHLSADLLQDSQVFLESDKVIDEAKSLMGAGFATEAAALLNNIDGEEALILQEAALLLDRHRPNELLADIFTTPNLCAGLTVWPYLSLDNISVQTVGDAALSALISELHDMPLPLRERMSQIIGLNFLKTEQDRAALRIWTVLQDTQRALLTDKPGAHFIPDTATQYFHARINQRLDPDIAHARFKYLAERESPYKLEAILSLRALEAARNKHPVDVQTDLEGLVHQFESLPQGREAALALSRHHIKFGRFIEAISVLKDHVPDSYFGRADVEDIISEKTLDKFSQVSVTDRTAGLNIYLSDQDFWQGSNDRDKLHLAAVQTSRDLGLEAIAEGLVVELTPALQPASMAMNSSGTDKINVYKMTQTDDGVAELPYVLMREIEAALQEGDIERAQTSMADLEDEKQRSVYENQIAWIQQDWNLLVPINGASEVKSNSHDFVKTLQKDVEQNFKGPMMSKDQIAKSLRGLDEEISIVEGYLGHE